MSLGKFTPRGDAAKEEQDPDDCFPESWDVFLEKWDAEAAELDLAYQDSDEEDIADNCHG